MSSSTILLLALLAALAASMVVAWAIVQRGRRQADAALAPLGTPLRSTAATALGRTGEGAPLNGTGTLVLTEGELGFAQWRPARSLRIRRADIVGAEAVREHLERTMQRDVLRVTWREAGAEESIAFFVRELDPWVQDLARGG